MFNFKNRTHFTIFKDDLIIIDTDEDSFYIINDVDYEKFIQNQPSELSEFLHELGLVSDAKYLTDNRDGYYEVRWLPRKYNTALKNPFLLLKTMHVMFSLRKIMENTGFRGLIYKLNTINKKGGWQRYQNEEIMDCVNFLMPFFFVDNPCLFYAFVLTYLLKNKGICSNLVVGVKTRPFISHAWVEIEGSVVGDDAELRNKLSVIMEV